MSDLGASIKEDIGPLPAWAWGLLAGGALVVFEYWRRLNTSTTTTATTVPDTTALDTPLDSSLNDIPASTSDGTDITAASLTNEDWVTEAEAALLHNGHDPITTFDALEAFIEGLTLTPAQAEIVGAAIAKFGPPPEGAAAASIGPAPTTYTVRKPPPGTKFVDDFAKNHTTWELWPDGTNHYVSAADYVFLGSPKRTAINVPPPKAPTKKK